MLPNVNVCVETCPTGYTGQELSCIGGSIEIEFVFNDKSIALSSNDVNTHVSGTPEKDPRPLWKRGMYFDGNDEIGIQNVQLNSVITLEFWIRPESDGKLLEIGPNYVEFGLTEYAPSYYLISLFTAVRFSRTKWTHVAYIVNNYDLTFYIDGVDAGSKSLDTVLIDKLDYTHDIGIGYVGFLYSVVIKNFVDVDFDIDEYYICSPLDECANCPKNVCLSECENNYYVNEGGTCSLCLDDCTYGCIRGTDCRKCSDILCNTCDGYDTCNTCVSGAAMTDGTCACLNDTFYDVETDRCGDCKDNCATCTDDPDDCTLCDQGFYMEDSECLPCA